MDELARLQPSEGYRQLVKARVVQVWDRAGEGRSCRAPQKTIRQKLDRLDNAFLYEQSIDIDT